MKLIRKLEDNSEDLKTKWKIGKFIVEAQGGELRSKYGSKLLEDLFSRLSSKYGKGYSVDNLENTRKFYICFLNSETLSRKLTWSHYVTLIKVKNK